MNVGNMIAAVALASTIIGALFGLIFKLAINGSVARGKATHHLLTVHMSRSDADLTYLRGKMDTATEDIGELRALTASLDSRVENIEGNRWTRRGDDDD